MPLTTYAEVRPWAKAIRHEILTRRMPPWGAVKGFGIFRNDASLSLPEMAVVSSWVEGGAPEGSSAFLEPYHPHPEPAARYGTGHGRHRVQGTARLDRDLVATGVSLVGKLDEAWLQITAHLAEGEIRHLLWIRGQSPHTPMDYWFLHAVELPEGTRLLCRPPSAAVDLRFMPAGKP